MPSNREGADERQQRFPCEQPHQASFPAPSAKPPLVRGKRKPLGSSASLERRPSPDRQKRHRLRARRFARTWRSLRSTNMAKGARDKIKLESTAGTGHFYTTTKNKRNMPEKMAIKKFDPVV